ncbi:E3 ubiquitin-protein ligase APD2-like [Magnolia sinica]|uniref:E3 ubiquitin-protein ligase APD2-like n=1 Tax=Magnolia sinica TaxID=86752 RepID=UPI002659047D|nr:E3 ubiquitin-protein ligase APD2-like [Magnolia sinica]
MLHIFQGGFCISDEMDSCIWPSIPSVTLGIQYGFYGNCHLVLGPNSSRLVETSSVFVEQIQATGDKKRGFELYGFVEKPELSLETNWTGSKYLFVESYGRQGFSLWLNKGSTIRVTWKVQPTIFDNILVVLTKGEKNFQGLLKHSEGYDALGLKNPRKGDGEVEYTVEDDDSYYIGAANLNPQTVVVTMMVEVSSKIYDTTKAKRVCSTKNGFCRITLPFPNTQYVVLATPDDADAAAWYVELSFVARLATYVAILGFVVVIISLVLKYLGACDVDERIEEEATNEIETGNETDPLIPKKEFTCLYGAIEEDEESSLSSSSKDLYDGKICVICYDEGRNCFFVPCGHCATCYTCAQRIVEGENKACPICRRLIHKVRRLLSPPDRDRDPKA